VAALRVLKLLPGMGAASARRAFGLLDGSKQGFDALNTFKPPAATADGWSALITLMHALAGSTEWKTDIERVRRWYDPLMMELYESAHTRLGDLDQLERIATQHPSRSSFLTDFTLDPPEACGGEAGPPVKDEDWLILSTIHSAKGQEWRAVYVLNVVDGCIPSDLATDTPEEIEEERRLLYVAMTRAKDELVLMQPLRFYVRGQASGSDKHVYAPRSRFVCDGDVEAFELVTPPPPEGLSTGSEPSTVRVDLKAQMRRMWAE